MLKLDRLFGDVVNSLKEKEKHALWDFLVSQSQIEGELGRIKTVTDTMSEILSESFKLINEKNSQMKAFFEMSEAALLYTDSDNWLITFANNRVAEMFGIASSAITGRYLTDFLHPLEVEYLNNYMKMMLEGDSEIVQSEHRFLKKDGDYFWGVMSAHCIKREDAALLGVAVTIYDSTKRRETEEALNRMQSNYWEIFNSTNDALFVHDAYSAAIMDINRSVEKMYGYTREEILFLNVDDLSSGKTPYTLNDAVHHIRMAVEEGPQTYEWHCKRKNGELFWGEVALTASQIGGEGRVLAVIRDITDRKEIEQKLQYLSVHDSLTGLYNRSHFEGEFKRVTKGRKYPISVIVADLDGLKEVNDTNGHAAGDKLIKLAAEVLRDAFRADDLVARIGGDEFAVLLSEADEEAANAGLARIREEEQLKNASAEGIQVKFSLGAATAKTSKRIDNLFHEADLKMYDDKATRKMKSDKPVRRKMPT